MTEEHDDDVVKKVEMQLVTKVAWFLIANVGVLLVTLGAGINAYYALNNRVSTTETLISINSKRIDRLIDEDTALRASIDARQNEITRMLREHDLQTQQMFRDRR